MSIAGLRKPWSRWSCRADVQLSPTKAMGHGRMKMCVMMCACTVK